MGLFSGLSKAWGKVWDQVNGDYQKHRQEKYMAQSNQQAANAMTTAQEAADKELDFQKILAYFQMRDAAQQGNLSNTMAAQNLAGTLAGQQQAANQFAQLYNQDLTNNLPQMQARLGALQALAPLMQMTGLQGYQLPTSLDTTKLTAPDIVGQFNTLSNMYQNQYNPAGTQAQQAQESADFLRAMADPAAFFAQQQQGATLPSHTGSPRRPIRASAPAGSIRVPPAGTQGATPAPMVTQVMPQGSPLTPYSPTTSTPTMTSLQGLTSPVQGSQLETDPVYQFRLKEAQRALANQLAARGQAVGGVATEANAKLALGMARDESNEKYNRLMNLVNIGLGGQGTQMGTNAGNQLASMYQQGAANTGAALQNISQAQNVAAQQRSGIYSSLANAYGNANATRANAMSNYQNSLAGNYQQMGNWAAQQPSGLSKVIDLGTKIYGASQGFNSGSRSSPFGYFGTKGDWSNPYSDTEFMNYLAS